MIDVGSRSIDQLRAWADEMYERGEQTADVVQVTRAILALDPSHEPSANQLGCTLMGLGRLDEAREVFEAAVLRNPRNSIAQGRIKKIEHLQYREANALPSGGTSSGGGDGKVRWDSHQVVTRNGKRYVRRNPRAGKETARSRFVREGAKYGGVRQVPRHLRGGW